MEQDNDISFEPHDERGTNRKRVRMDSYIVSVRKKKCHQIPGKIKSISPDGQHFRVKMFPPEQAPFMETFKRQDFQLYHENVQPLEHRDNAENLPDEAAGFLNTPPPHLPHNEQGDDENALTGASNAEMEEIGGED
jgi:hypothetical protein